MIPTQYSLVNRLRSGGSDSDWERFYVLYEKPILAFAAARELNASECCDVLQETMVTMLRSGFARFDPAKGSFTNFLFHIVNCSVIDAIRRRTRQNARIVSLDTPQTGGALSDCVADGSETPATAAERHGQIALVLVVLDFLISRKSFRSKTVALFKAVTIEEKDAAEVAETFHTSVGNVYEAKRAVLAKLRSALEKIDTGCDLEQAIAPDPAAVSGK